MKEFKFLEGNNELTFFFFFDKTSTIISALFSILLIFVMFFNIKFSILLDKWIYVIVLFLILIYLTFNKYFEWNKNKYQHLLLNDGSLWINNEYFLKMNELHTVNISYSVNQFESGWTVYLENFLRSKKYTIKKRLKEEDAFFIAEKISIFLNKKIVVDN